ncbi:B3 domain-containing protein At1g49475-like [Rosa rugosa]|uniref:B3 domain-containing protein At1g49475-like n=1 Tax=Rosa rugosa TaxID=74645 RepID=UPI002B412E4B|nr:B3 domain-containing protein At1g49475-like [Rosa rugosa]
MTSLCRKKDPGQKFSPTKCSLLRSISEDSPTTYLKIPRIYLKKCREKYEKELSKVIHLKLPCGTEWKVEVTEHKGHFWFEKGWEDFFKFYSLQSNGSIDFQYEGNSRFKVKIYDKSKIEIDYPIKSTDMQENGVNDHSPLASPPQPQKKKEATSSGGKEDLSANKDEGGKSSTTQRSLKPAEVPMRMDSSATGGKATALQKANEFKSRNPSCFLVTMHSSYIKGHRLVSSALIDLVSVIKQFKK